MNKRLHPLTKATLLLEALGFKVSDDRGRPREDYDVHDLFDAYQLGRKAGRDSIDLDF